MAENGAAEGNVGAAEGQEHKTIDHGARVEATAATIATVVAMDAARYDPELCRAASEYLKGQSALVSAATDLARIQAHHFDEELQLALEAAKRKRFSDHFRMSFLVFLTVVASAIGIGAIGMVWEAATSKNVVVNAFDTAPALVEQGLTGKVVATRVLDALQKMQEATRVTNAGWKSKSAWSSDVKIEVPETGISIGEINHILHERLGHDIRIYGGIDLSKAGVATLIVRGEGIPAAHFTGQVEDLNKLATQAAEYIYGRSQAWQYSTYLVNTNRSAEAVEFFPGALSRASAEEAPELANQWGNALVIMGRVPEAILKYRLAMSLRPHYWKAWGNVVSGLLYTESEEAANRESKAMLKAAAEQGVKVDGTVDFQNSWLISHDFPALINVYQANISQNNGVGTAVSLSGPSIADFYANLHDYPEAGKWLARSDPEDAVTQAETMLLPAYEALERGQASQALPHLKAFWDAWFNNKALQNDMYSDQACMVGLAYGLTGDLKKAEEVFSRNRPWSYCFAVHGDVLEHSGDLLAAEKVWAEGLLIGPSLSPIYLHRGISEANRGDFKRAEADLAAANERSPHWADPLKAWGDALFKQGRWKEALNKYNAALVYAPNWPALIAARDAARAKGA